MDWLTQYINIYYMMTFMSVCWFVFNKTSLLKKTIINSAWWTLIVGVATGIIYWSMGDVDHKVLITTFTTGTSFYELIIKHVMKKRKLQY